MSDEVGRKTLLEMTGTASPVVQPVGASTGGLKIAMPCGVQWFVYDQTGDARRFTRSAVAWVKVKQGAAFDVPADKKSSLFACVAHTASVRMKETTCD
jgi:hypothetical protein